MMSQSDVFETVKEAVVYTAKKFSSVIDNYNSQTRVCLFYDDDPDGICSGIILEKFFGMREIPVVEKIPFSKDVPPFSEKFKEIIRERKINSLVMTDFSINGFNYLGDYYVFREEFPDVEIIIFDHHQDKSDYKIDTFFNANELQTQVIGSQLCCSKFVYEVCRLINPEVSKLSWIKAIGMIADSNQITWGRDIIKLIKELNLNLQSDPAGNTKEYSIPVESDEYYQNPFGKIANLAYFGLSKSDKEIMKIYDILFNSSDVLEALGKFENYKDIEEEVNDYIENYNYYKKNSPKPEGIEVFEMEVKGEYDIQCILSNLLSHKNPDTFFIIYKKSKDGFIYSSFRLQNKKVNTGKLAALAKQFPDGNGGGHIQASGIKIKKDDFKPFKKLLFEKLARMKV